MKNMIRRHKTIEWPTISPVAFVTFLAFVIISTPQIFGQEAESKISSSVSSKQETIEEEKFSIKFPSKPRKITTKTSVNDQELNILHYQSDDGTGLYTISLGTLQKSLTNKNEKKSFIQDLFDGLLSTTTGARVHTRELSDEIPYHLTYLYTSEIHNLEWIHIGLIFLISDSEYIKLTLIYPVDQIEIAMKKYEEFLNSFKLKD